jgi:hypothetical protein
MALLMIRPRQQSLDEADFHEHTGQVGLNGHIHQAREDLTLDECHLTGAPGLFCLEPAIRVGSAAPLRIALNQRDQPLRVHLLVLVTQPHTRGGGPLQRWAYPPVQQQRARAIRLSANHTKTLFH